MKRKLLLKILALYGLLALLSFFVASTLGRQLAEDARTRNQAERLYRIAQKLASPDTWDSLDEADALLIFRKAGQFLEESANVDLLLVDLSGNILFESANAFANEETEALKGFNYASFGPGYYEVSDFFGHFQEDTLSVLLPILEGYRPKGYAAASLPMSVIVAEREEIMFGVDVVVAVNLVLAMSLLVFFSLFVDRPLQEISQGARQFAAGNLSHHIEVHTKDEMGALADNLNFMASQLRKNNEYQTAFIANVSHDLRTPLTSIKGFSEAMIDGTIPPEMHAHYLEVIASEADRLEEMTSKVLSLDKMQRGEATLLLGDFDINALLRGTAELFEGSCRKKKISIRLLLTGKELMVRADQGKIRQVVSNLLDNAIKFSGRGAAIELESSVRHGKCFISVRDEGPGIPPADIPRIWDRFYKSDASRGKDKRGSGLGLSIVKQILSAHGQPITVTSTENAGTSFDFSLPLA